MKDRAAPMSETTSATPDRRERLARIGQKTRFQPGNQKRRIYPKPPSADDGAVVERLRERRDEITRDLGGATHISAIKLGAIERYTMLELHVENWEQFFLRAGFATRQGRVRSGYAGGYLASVTHLMRLAQIIGLERVERQSTLTTRQWLEAARDKQEPAGESASTEDSAS